MEDAFAADIEKEMRGKMEGEWRKRLKALQEEKDTLQSEKDRMTQERRQIDLLKQQQEEEVTKRVLAGKKQLQENLEAELRKSITADLDNQLAVLKEANLEQEEKLKEAICQRQQFQKRAAFLEELNHDLQEISEHNKKIESQLRRVSDMENLLARITGSTGDEMPNT